jgi:hypothetical protein
VSASLVYVFLLTNCAGLSAKLDAPMKTSIQGKRVVVFPFQDPWYKGLQIQGIGEPFASVFANKLRVAGVSAGLPKSKDFSSQYKIEIGKACKYAASEGYELLVIGTVTEWIDGATNWSGKVDVAALSVSIYSSTICELLGSASGMEKGTWFTFVNAPTMRFFDSLSGKIVAVLLEQGI